jgi:hypothetical protein
VADNRTAFAAFSNVLQSIKIQWSATNVAPIDFVLACGDFDPAPKNDAIYQSIFGEKGPVLFPVRGNHEEQSDVDHFLKVMLPRGAALISNRTGSGCGYCIDRDNVRVVVVDQYADRNADWMGTNEIRWTERMIAGATNAAHVFVAFHEPVFMNYGSGGGSPDAAHRDFWNMIVRHADKVRAVIVGHSHKYSRMRVKDPAAVGSRLPDEPGGVYQIDCGNAGNRAHSDGKSTFVAVEVNGGDVAFKTYQEPDGATNFVVTDQWEIKPGTVPRP